MYEINILRSLADEKICLPFCELWRKAIYLDTHVVHSDSFKDVNTTP
jgi:hypothetical protein